MATLQNTVITSPGFLTLPSGTDQERPNNPQDGYIYFNTTANQIEFYDTEYSRWFPLGKERPPVASGGNTEDTITIAGLNYSLHAFTNTGLSSIVFSRSGVVEYLVVAGGGGSGSYHFGGGGAGGLLYGSQRIQAGTYDVFVGSGGENQGEYADSGEDSFLQNIRAIGGGGTYGHFATVAEDNGRGLDGGSGGGGGGREGFGGKSVIGQGNPGSQGSRVGTGSPERDYASTGGGGGAGQPGGFPKASASISIGGDGGQGIYLGNIFGSSFGDEGWFAGGGGGSCDDRTTDQAIPGKGGKGGGGSGITLNGIGPGTGGQPNTGGGAGAGDNKAGGSGIILIKYLIN